MAFDYLAEFGAHWDLAARARACPRCKAPPNELCVAPDGTTAAGGLCHRERLPGKK